MAIVGSVGSLHLAEFVPPVRATLLYLLLYRRRIGTLARQHRPVARWRTVLFVTGVLMVALVQLPPLDGLADSLLVAHMLQHIVIGDVASLLIVLGLTGPMLDAAAAYACLEPHAAALASACRAGAVGGRSVRLALAALLPAGD